MIVRICMESKMNILTAQIVFICDLLCFEMTFELLLLQRHGFKHDCKYD